MQTQLPSSTAVTIEPQQDGSFLLSQDLFIDLPRDRVFPFFEDPRNLFDITPDWLHFVVRNKGLQTKVFEGAEFEYRIRWLGLPLPWRSRIVDYLPPLRFIDVQLAGPYRSWRHLHLFEERPGGTLMRDRISYRLPAGAAGRLVHAIVVRRQLEDIFRYRAGAIEAWSRGEFRGKPRH